MDFELLVNELKRLNSQIGSYAYYIFGLKYAQELNNVNIAQLIKSAGLTESMSKEIGKAKKVAELIQSGEYGIYFESSLDDNVVFIKNKKEDDAQYSKEQIVQILADIYDSDIEKSAAGGIFIFKYGKYVVDKYTPTELMREAHLLNPNVKERYAAELNGAFLMYRYFQNNPTEFNVSCGLSTQKISELFAAYLQNEGKSEATIDRYVKQVPNNSEVQNVVQSVAGTTALFDVMDVAKLLQISQKVAAQDFDQKGGNMYSAGINSYTHFISNYRLFVKHLAKRKKDTIGQNTDSSKFPLQTIFYGAPGTGKSHKVKSEKLAGVPEENIFRTTFHPDYDYASFVGCYKPTKEKSAFAKQPILDYDTLVDKFKEYLNVPNVNITKECTLFGYDYHDSIIEIQNNGKKVADLVNDAYKSNTTYDSVVRGGMSCYESHPALNNASPITYSFIPQVFTKAYIKAWKEMKQENPQPIYLVIEEINRGNCAQIFGDIFQLLDRNDAGFSTYPIAPDADITRELKKVFENLDLSSVENYINGIFSENYPGRIVDKIKSGELLVLPCNLNLLATMNTSDQSLFPMDSAFKRRWDWEYVAITNAEKNWRIEIDDTTKIDWWTFLQSINMVIADLTSSEDKQLGYFFTKPDEFVEKDETKRAADAQRDLISAKRFVSKVIFYLWNDVFKDYGFEPKCCKDDAEKEVLYAKFYAENGKDINLDVLRRFFMKLKDENGNPLL